MAVTGHGQGEGTEQGRLLRGAPQVGCHRGKDLVR